MRGFFGRYNDQVTRFIDYIPNLAFSGALALMFGRDQRSNSLYVRITSNLKFQLQFSFTTGSEVIGKGRQKLTVDPQAVADWINTNVAPGKREIGRSWQINLANLAGHFPPGSWAPGQG